PVLLFVVCFLRNARAVLLIAQ
ncbi:hypothetical protein A2U01_0095171, partial [Trifolium medium]|nr:hypothetical protein [Trifolium medium]